MRWRLGAIFPPIVWSVVALRCLGYSANSAEVGECLRQLESLMIKEDGMIRLQPCKSPVWDTAITVRALAATESPPAEAIQRGVDWLLARQRSDGGWSMSVPKGSYTEHNEIHVTGLALLALMEAPSANGVSTPRPNQRGGSSNTRTHATRTSTTRSWS